MSPVPLLRPCSKPDRLMRHVLSLARHARSLPAPYACIFAATMLVHRATVGAYCDDLTEHAPKEGGADFPAKGGVGSPGAEVHFSVMHVVHPKDGDTRQAASAKTDANTGVFALMHHADSMLDRDNAQLDQVSPQSLPHSPTSPSSIMGLPCFLPCWCLRWD